MTEQNSALQPLAQRIKQWGNELGFADVGISGTDLRADEPHLLSYLAANYHGEMDY
ncbi:MAG: tRNA epoxyqueuosine(34) reductase QueG, partial [Gammaproteobacteria bacterium]|nr:tRNA epoxyqueuosine(34) reductase QueG [Gammaproteobacteria bacterium]